MVKVVGGGGAVVAGAPVVVAGGAAVAGPIAGYWCGCRLEAKFGIGAAIGDWLCPAKEYDPKIDHTDKTENRVKDELKDLDLDDLEELQERMFHERNLKQRQKRRRQQDRRFHERGEEFNPEGQIPPDARLPPPTLEDLARRRWPITGSTLLGPTTPRQL